MLVVAHPDDEILWFNPSLFDLIVIVFCDREDRATLGEARRKVISQLPYAKKIMMLNLVEPGTWKDKSRVLEYNAARVNLLDQLAEIRKDYQISCVFTHNYAGEYGHLDHILVHESVMEIFFHDCPIWTPNIFINKDNTKLSADIECAEKNDMTQFLLARNLYLKYEAWTWNLVYLPDETQSYSQVKKGIFYGK